MSAFMLRYIFFSQEVLTYGQSMESIQRIRSKIWHSIQTVVRKNYESNAEALLFFYILTLIFQIRIFESAVNFPFPKLYNLLYPKRRSV